MHYFKANRDKRYGKKNKYRIGVKTSYTEPILADKTLLVALLF
jgi:hypothetical protein